MRELICKCIEAVGAEIAAASKNRAAERSIHVVNGRFQRTADQQHIYVFSVPRDVPSSYDDAPVKLLVSNNEISGSIVGLGEFEVVVALDDFLGQYIAEAELVIDLTFILKKLKEMLEGRAASLEINAVARKAMGIDEARLGEAPPSVLDDKLNQAQTVALRKCLGSDFLMVWGPPGTGKTHVMARLLREEVLAGRTILLVSNTNIAVDQALAKFLELCDSDERLKALFEQGKFVRLGVPHLDDADRLVLDKVVERLNAHIRRAIEKKRAKLERLTERLEETESSASNLGHLIELKATIERLASACEAANQALLSARAEKDRVSRELQQASAQLEALRQKTGIGRIIAKLSEPALSKKVTVLKEQSADAAMRFRDASAKNSSLRQELRATGTKYRELAAGSGSPDEWAARLQQLGQAATAQRSEAKLLKDQIAKLESRLSGIRDRVLRGAVLVACTCAKSTLDDVVSARQFDTVVADESSMISIPQGLWCASLAKQRFLCFGDFCQLPPISSIDEENDPEHYRIMHSSIFEQNGISLGTALEDPRVQMLDEQFRMPSLVCALVSDAMYRGRLKTSRCEESGARCPLNLISTSGFNAWSDKTEAFSWFNWHHAFVAVELVRQLAAEKTANAEDRSRIMIMSPFRAQVEIIRSLLKEADLENAATVSTVWRSQGREAEIVILDTVCAPPFKMPGRWFLDEPGPADGARLFNVAVTRTMSRLYLIAHLDYLKQRCPQRSLAKVILAEVEQKGTLVDSRDMTANSLPDSPDAGGGFPILTFPSNSSAVYDEAGFAKAFAQDIDSMPDRSTITIFSPFLNEGSVAHWGPKLRAAVQRGCRVEVLTRRPGHQSTFNNAAQVESLIEELKSLGAVVGFDSYVEGQKPMHHKIAVLRFPEDSEAPIVWKGSMNALGHYSSAELMDRTQSMELYNCLAQLLKLPHLRAALDGTELAKNIEEFLRSDLNAVCPVHRVPMNLKLARRARYKSFFMSCPRWGSEQCPETMNVDVNALNKALASIGATCLEDGCEAPVEARHGSKGVYLKCRNGHFVNLTL